MKQLDENLHKTFAKIKEEIEDHRESINQNTNEIQSNYEYLCKLEAKIYKLIERLDELTLVNAQQHYPSQDELSSAAEDAHPIPKLSHREQEVFLVLYTTERSLTYGEIARKAALNETLVMNYIVTLISKGIPIVKRYVNNVVYVLLDNDFKQLQEKENIVGINVVR